MNQAVEQSQQENTFNVGDRVKFIILRNPAVMIRVGVVSEVLEPHEHLKEKLSNIDRDQFDTSGLMTTGSRNHRSYLIEVESHIPGRRPKLYWPLVKHVLPAVESN